MTRLEQVLEEASLIVEPEESERRHVTGMAAKLLSTCMEEFEGCEGFLSASIEGSVAKDTWVKGRAEVDVFIHFSPDVGMEKLESTILSVGGRVIEGLGGRHWLRYASHPYIEGEVEAVRVNIVGCFETGPGHWISAVDRTPYHTEFVRSRLTPELRRDIRLLKGFLIGSGLYGAEIRVEGISGYLSELLVIGHAGFTKLLRSVAGWRPPVYIELNGSIGRAEALKQFPNAPLILPDPVDPARNVAAAVSTTKLAEFILASKLFIRSPSVSFFKPPEMVMAEEGDRELLGVFFKVAELPPDILWGEIKHTMRGVARRLEKEGFQVYRAGAAQSGNEVLLLYELAGLTLPRYELRMGPPVWMENALDFIEKTLRRGERAAGPWVEGERLYALLRREDTEADRLLRRWIEAGQVAVSHGLKEELRRAEILTSRSGLFERIKENKDFREFLYSLLDGVSPPIRHLGRRS
ncbi:MAG: CCA tRNA nucleotidyltransferase [Nitrososphaerota archaeon]